LPKLLHKNACWVLQAFTSKTNDDKQTINEHLTAQS
jgi:hypothetical protein